MDYWLKGYDGEKRKFLVKGFKVGFRIPFAGQRSWRLSGNATSFTKNLDILKQKLQIEIDNQRVAGPFKVIPFQNFQNSPWVYFRNILERLLLTRGLFITFLFLRALRSMMVFRRNLNQFNIRI